MFSGARHSPGLRAVCGLPRLTNARSRASLWMLTRSFSRGIPYTHEGTIQDFTGSPKHVGFAKKWEETDRAARGGASLHSARDYSGPMMTTRDGLRPVFASGAAKGSFHSTSMDCSGPPPGYNSMQDFYAETVSMSGDSYRPDCRIDPRFAHLPPHVRSAQQSILAMHEESIRGMVPPPPPVNPDEAPEGYTPPRVALPAYWGTLVSGFIAVFALMGIYGR